jgi:hypothetical protein
MIECGIGRQIVQYLQTVKGSHAAWIKIGVERAEQAFGFHA